MNLVNKSTSAHIFDLVIEPLCSQILYLCHINIFLIMKSIKNVLVRIIINIIISLLFLYRIEQLPKFSYILNKQYYIF